MVKTAVSQNKTYIEKIICWAQMIPRLDISFSLKNQWAFCFGQAYAPAKGEYLLDHARSGIVMALRTALPEGGRVGVVTYNCHTVANAVVESGIQNWGQKGQKEQKEHHKNSSPNFGEEW